MPRELSSVELYWLPLGAGGHSVRLNGRVFEAVVAGLERRSSCDLYHSALVVRAPSGRFVIEQGPMRDGNGADRGVVAEGAVGSHLARRFRIFRYEVRRWRNGVIPDVAEAVASPQLLTQDPTEAERLLDLVPRVPTPVWGRDELDAGEMWNSNSLISWLIARSDLDVETIKLPDGPRSVLGRWVCGGSPRVGTTFGTKSRLALVERDKATGVEGEPNLRRRSRMRPAGFEPATRGLEVRRSVH
jgi:hypothetical protein